MMTNMQASAQTTGGQVPADATKVGNPGTINSGSTTTSSLISFDTQHDDMIHDAQMDYYGKMLATASSDRTIRIHVITTASNGNTEQKLTHTLKGHEGPVWQVSWAHPKYGTLLASCSFDAKVLIWRLDENSRNWEIIYTHAAHNSSVNAVSWAPSELGLLLACASSDGRVTILKWQEDTGAWISEADFMAHQLGCNTVSWAPVTAPGSMVSTDSQNTSSLVKKICTGGSDNSVKIWNFDREINAWMTASPEVTLTGFEGWVRDVAWAPNLGLPVSYIAACSQDCTAIIWSNDARSSNEGWQKKQLMDEQADPPTPKFPAALWRVSWSPTSGHLLAVSGGDNLVRLWKRTMDDWVCVGAVEDGSATGYGN